MSIIDQSIVSATNFLVGFMLARLCSQSEYGVFVLGFSVILFIQGFQTALLTNPLMVIGASMNADRFQNYVSNLGAIQILIGGVLCLICLIVAKLLFIMNLISSPTSKMLIFLSPAILFTQTKEFLRKVLLTRLMTKRVLFLDAFHSGLILITLIFIWKLGGGEWKLITPGFLSAVNALCCMTFSAVLTSLLGLHYSRNMLIKKIVNMRHSIQLNVDFGKWGLGTMLGGICMIQGIIWIAAIFGGTVQAANLEAPRLLMAPLQVIMVGSSNILIPQISKRFSESSFLAIKLFLKKIGAIWLLIFGSYALTISLAPSFWLHTFFGNKYEAAKTGLILWIGIYTLLGLRQLPTIALNAIRRPDVIMWITLVSGLVTLFLSTLMAGSGGYTSILKGRLIGDVILGIGMTFNLYIIMKGKAKRNENLSYSTRMQS